MRWLKVVDAITRARYLVNIDHIWEIGVELYNIVPDKPGRWCLMIRFQGKKTPSTLKMYTDCQIPLVYLTEDLMHKVQDCIADYSGRWVAPPVLDINKVAAELCRADHH